MALGEIKRREQKGHTALSLISMNPPVQTRTKSSRTVKVDIRIREDLWAEFLELCKDEGTSASEEIRSFIRSRIG